jgi:hypothetical protein
MVATAAQIAANRANARRSTGPRSPEGKAASSRNALTHGAHASDDTILATAPNTYLEDFRAHFQPANALEAHLVSHLAVLASRRERLHLAMEALLELNERHALIEHLHERYGVNTDTAFIDGQPSWQAALRRYDGNTYVDDRFPEPASDPDLDPDPILCSLAYTLSGPRATAISRHEAAVDRRFTATLKELTAAQTQRRAAAAATAAPTTSVVPPTTPLYEPRLQRALDHYLRETGAPARPHHDPPAPAILPSRALNTAAPTSDPISRQPFVATLPFPTPGVAGRASLPEQSQSARPAPQSCPPPEQHEPTACAPADANAPDATADDRDAATRPVPSDRTIEPTAGAIPPSFGAALAAKLRENGIEPIVAAYLAGDDSTLLSVLPRHPDQPSLTPSLYPAPILAAGRKA